MRGSSSVITAVVGVVVGTPGMPNLTSSLQITAPSARVSSLQAFDVDLFTGKMQLPQAQTRPHSRWKQLNIVLHSCFTPCQMSQHQLLQVTLQVLRRMQQHTQLRDILAGSAPWQTT